MKTLRPDARWRTFTSDQRRQIAQWLFHDKLSYRKTLRRMNTELGLRCSLSTVCAIRHHLDKVHTVLCAVHTRELVAKCQSFPENRHQLHADHRAVIAASLFEAAMNPDTIGGLQPPRRDPEPAESPESLARRNEDLRQKLHDIFMLCGDLLHGETGQISNLARP